MIEENKLKELIKKGKTIYTIDDYIGKVIEINLNKDFKIKNNSLYVQILYTKIGVTMGGCRIPLRDLYTTKSQAKWAADVYTTREEEFRPPTYEDVLNDLKGKPMGVYTVIEFYGKGGASGLYDEIYSLNIFIDKNQKMIIECSEMFDSEFTKSNYTKAVKTIRKYFIGERKWKI